jgi:shikimate kinase
MTDFLRGTNLFLIGMMGAGKTTVGQILARQLDYRFFDTDDVIEQAAGQPISTIFAEQGEAGFRQLESRVLAELSTYTRLAIATGGGIVLQRENWGFLHHGVVVWLDVPLEELEQRLQTDTQRPLLQEGNLTVRLQTLMEQRRHLYQQADVRVEWRAGNTPEQVADQVLTQIQAILKPAMTPTNDTHQ